MSDFDARQRQHELTRTFETLSNFTEEDPELSLGRWKWLSARQLAEFLLSLAKYRIPREAASELLRIVMNSHGDNEDFVAVGIGLDHDTCSPQNQHPLEDRLLDLVEEVRDQQLAMEGFNPLPIAELLERDLSTLPDAKIVERLRLVREMGWPQ